MPAAISKDDRAPVLVLKDITKAFDGLHALDGVSIDLRRGEAHALVGENGAGKSTMVRVLAGVHRPDSGHILLNGTPVTFDGPAAAQRAGIAVIYQEPALCPDLSVAENIFLGRPPLTRARRVDRRQLNARCEELFGVLGVQLAPQKLGRGLSIADQQMIEIAKALSMDARVLVMDEPTAALSGADTERLFRVVSAIRDRGAAILFISHRLNEIFDLCQRVTVLRDGRWISTDDTNDLSVSDVVRRMVGREVSSLYPKLDVTPGNVVLEVSGLSRAGAFRNVTFSVREGEIVSLAGLVGAGRTEVVRAIFGIDRYDRGEVSVAGARVDAGKPVAAIAAGIALVPEDRRQQGLIMELSTQRNITFTQCSQLARWGWIRQRRERAAADKLIDQFQVHVGQLTNPVSTLSGGNQQKVVLAKWLSKKPRMLIVDEPTRGIDVGTKAEVHRLLSTMAAEGMAVLMVSSELAEVLGMADRILVMSGGRIVDEISRADATEARVMFAATGVGVSR